MSNNKQSMLNKVFEFIKKVFTYNRCDVCGLTQDNTYVTEYFTEAGFIECEKCYNKRTCKINNNEQSSIDKEFVPYKEALALKELGFDKPCFAWYVSERYGLEFGGVVKDELIRDAVLAPTFSQAFRFFRDTYGWQHSIEPTADQQSNSLGYNYWIWNYRTGEEYRTEPKNRPVGDWVYEKHEEAELECLKRLIEITRL